MSKMGVKLNSINDVLERIEKMEVEDQTYLAEVIQKRIIDLRRSEIVKRSIEAEKAYKEGKVKKGSLKDLLEDLND